MTSSTKDVFAMAWPLALKAVMLHGILVIDAYLVSPLGEEALAAMGLAGAIAGILLGILFAFSNATQIRIAQAFGSAGPIGLKTGFYSGLFINLISTMIGLIIAISISTPVFNAFAHTPWIAEQAQAYLNVFLFVVLFEAVGQCLTSYFNGCSKTKTSFQSYLIALPINIIVSYVLIHGLYGFPQLGVVGAAYGTVAASLARLMFMGRIFKHNYNFYLDIKGWSRNGFTESLKAHFVFSWPIAATFISMIIGNQVCTLIYAKMSINQFAAMALIAPWIQVLGTFGMAWAQATGISVAQLLGRGTSEADLDKFLSSTWRAAFIAAGLVALSYLIFCLSAGWIYRDLQNETTIALLSFLPVLLLLPFPKGSNAICGQTLRASGDTLYVMKIFMGGQWLVKVPITFLFVVYFELPIVWVLSVFVLEELFKFPLFHKRLYKGDWKQAMPKI